MNYYNEWDAGAAQWIRNLIAAGEIPPGDVDERSICDVKASDVKGYTQRHWFAGVGGWALALRRAGWPDDRAIDTASCPCQPYSSAGKGAGDADARNLWPECRRLIRECHPEIIIGEQVASAEVVGTRLEASFVVAVQAGDYARANKLAKQLAQTNSFHYSRRWVDGIQADLAALDYAFGFTVLGAHSFGGPHIRQRLYWVAYAGSPSARRYSEHGIADAACSTIEVGHCGQATTESERCGDAVRLEHATRDGRGEGWTEPSGRLAASGCGGSGLGDTIIPGLEGHSGNGDTSGGPQATGSAGTAGAHGDWSDYYIVHCTDGHSRRVECGAFPLVNGVPARVGPLLARLGGLPADAKRTIRNARSNRLTRIKGYGNAICIPTATGFVLACMESIDGVVVVEGGAQ